MDRRETSLRVVTVSRDGLLTAEETARLAAGGIRCEQVASPYEAAAALLAAPAAAVAVDMPLLSRKHLRMLELARKLGVAVLGTGAMPAGLTSDDLRGVRLLARGELTDELLSMATGRYVAAASEGQGVEEPEGTYEPRDQAEAYQQQSKTPVSLDEPRQTDEPDESSPGEQSPQAPRTPEQRPRGAADVLSSDEIAALLEEDF